MSESEKTDTPVSEQDEQTRNMVQPVPEKSLLYWLQQIRAQITSFISRVLYAFNIGHLLLVLLGLHIFAMSFPNGNNQYVFDEAYYVPAANDLLHLVPSNLEHPFFGKIWGALGIYLFGNDFFGWRIFYVLIGVAAVWVLYELALVFFSKEKALLAASMLGFETLFFIHTSLLLLEGPADSVRPDRILSLFQEALLHCCIRVWTFSTKQGMGYLFHSGLVFLPCLGNKAYPGGKTSFTWFTKDPCNIHHHSCRSNRHTSSNLRRRLPSLRKHNFDGGDCTDHKPDKWADSDDYHDLEFTQ